MKTVFDDINKGQTISKYILSGLWCEFLQNKKIYAPSHVTH